MAQKADRIVYGNIYTVDKACPKATAVAIADGRFVYVGDEEGAREFVGENTEEQRFEGGIVLPGLGGGHGHVNPGGTEALFMVNLLDGSSLDAPPTLEDIRSRVKGHIEAHPDWDVYLGTGFLPVPESPLVRPTADMLDGLTDKPIVITDIGHHSYWVNHAAKNRMGIDKDTPDVSDGII